jgi:hypothetical protein
MNIPDTLAIQLRAEAQDEVTRLIRHLCSTPECGQRIYADDLCRECYDEAEMCQASDRSEHSLHYQQGR